MSEHDDQAVFVDYVLFKYQHCENFVRKLFFGVPNGMWAGGNTARKRATTITKMKQEGFTPGVADILYLQPRGPYSYLAIEMKDPIRRNYKDALSEDQKLFLQAAKSAFALVAVCFGADEAMKVFDEYMELDPVSKNFTMRGE